MLTVRAGQRSFVSVHFKNKNSVKNTACGQLEGDLALETNPLEGNLFNTNILKTTLGSERLSWIYNDCGLYDTIGTVWNTSDQSQSYADMLADLIDFLILNDGDITAKQLAMQVLLEVNNNTLDSSLALQYTRTIYDVANDRQSLTLLSNPILNRIFVEYIGVGTNRHKSIL